jgi:hypothetical protein
VAANKRGERDKEGVSAKVDPTAMQVMELRKQRASSKQLGPQKVFHHRRRRAPDRRNVIQLHSLPLRKRKRVPDTCLDPRVAAQLFACHLVKGHRVSGILSSRVTEKQTVWRRIGEPLVVRRWIREGYRFPVVKRIKPFDGSRKPKWEHQSPLREMIGELLVQGTLAPTNIVDFVSHCRLEPKKEKGTYRLIVNLRNVNEHLRTSRCYYESTLVLIQMLEQDDWMFSLDF